MDGPTDLQTNGLMVKASYRIVCLYLKFFYLKHNIIPRKKILDVAFRCVKYG